MRPRRDVGGLHVITDVVVQSRFDHVQLAEMACAGGARVIQLRDKSLPADEFTRIASRILAVCRDAGAYLIVNDRVAEASAAGADGVHVGAGDAPIAQARARLGEDAIVGVSAGSIDAALAAERAGADYVGVGHVFATTSKHKPGPPLGLDSFGAICRRVNIPVIGIGGITVERAADVMRSGASGVAVIAAVCAARDPREAARRLAQAISAHTA